MRDEFVAYALAPVFGWICFATAVYFAMRRPVANIFLGLAISSLGGVPLILGLTFARLSGVIGLMTIISLLARQGGSDTIQPKVLLRGPMSWFVWLCLVIFGKIFLETFIYGLDPSRMAAFMGALQDSFFPILVLLLGLARVGLSRVERDLVISMAVFPVLAVVGHIPFALQDGLLQDAWYGMDRFTLGNMDTINSARIICFGVIGWLLVFVLQETAKRIVQVFALGVAAGFVLLLLLTGTRQFLIVMLVFAVLWAFLLQKSGKVRLLISALVLGVGAYTFVYFVNSNNIVLKERVKVESLEDEATESRGAIWLRAAQNVLQHPLIGVGFKNFGEETQGVDRAGNPVILRDNAHGAMQDVFAEHGILLGFAFMCGFFQLSWRAVSLSRRDKVVTLRKCLILSLFSLEFALLFSSSFLNATPVYLLLILFIAWNYLLVERPQSSLRNPKPIPHAPARPLGMVGPSRG
jgi:O-antigen ligase